MPEDAPRPAQAAIRTDLGAIFVSLELSRRAWLITSLSPGGGEKMSKHSVPAGEVSGLLRRFAELRRKAVARTGPGLPDYRHPGGRFGRLLDPPGAVPRSLLPTLSATCNVAYRPPVRASVGWRRSPSRATPATILSACCQRVQNMEAR
jgi:transposase